ncbi:hypothetical protein [Pseudoxanthomonas winnipegensis]|uniref:hypothetical protein n=1 Tax=Pseudoxanthomonas winnipegensis TaxID=2480810 RepID=UPI0013EEB0EC|nr:hypothetical protein [Pseudoxanthomonas winnipegensis]
MSNGQHYFWSRRGLATAQHQLLNPVQRGVYATLGSWWCHCWVMVGSGRMGLRMELASHCQHRLRH